MSTRVVVFGVRCRLVGAFRPLHLRLAPGQFQPPQHARHPTSRVLGSARMETTPDIAVTSVLKTTKRLSQKWRQHLGLAEQIYRPVPRRTSTRNRYNLAVKS
jgi:hypothetical protein